MKILVLSDSHGNISNMLQAVEREQPRMVFHLGDCWRDGERLHSRLPDLPFEQVVGNCDFRGIRPVEKLVFLEDRRVLLCHGHTYGVKSGMGGAIAAARAQGVDALLFGHTHEAFCDLLEDLWVMNPGSIGSLLSPTYGIIRITEAGMVCYTEAY